MGGFGASDKKGFRSTTTLSIHGDGISVVPLLPTDFGLPPLPYALALAAFAAATAAVWYRRRPPVTEATVAALAPWMAAGGGLYALYQITAYPGAIAPLFGSPAVYVTVGILVGLVWAGVANRPAEGWSLTTAPGVLVACGSVLLASVLVAAASVGVGRGSVTLLWSGVSMVGAVVLTGAVWAGVRRTDAGTTGLVGVVVVFAHALDGVSTAIGYDLVGVGEQTPLSRIILEIGGSLPTAELIGAGWLFALVKLALAAGIVYFFADYVREAPAEGYLLLGVIAAVGLGPGAHNVVLFALL